MIEYNLRHIKNTDSVLQNTNMYNYAYQISTKYIKITMSVIKT